MPNTPNINIQNGSVTGTLETGEPFYWYNPTGTAVAIGNCGTWCEDSSYKLPAGPGYTPAQILATPNGNAYAWVEGPSEWTGNGQPHITGENPGGGPNTPFINIEDGEATGALADGVTFWWYNPATVLVTISSCGVWTGADSYPCSPGYTQASILTKPNENGWAWTENPNEWNTPGMPHVTNPPIVAVGGLNERGLKKDVA